VTAESGPFSRVNKCEVYKHIVQRHLLKTRLCLCHPDGCEITISSADIYVHFYVLHMASELCPDITVTENT
jgi:hypothetical protein